MNLEDRLKESGVKVGSGEIAQKAAEATVNNAGDFVTSRIVEAFVPKDRKVDIRDDSLSLPPEVTEYFRGLKSWGTNNVEPQLRYLNANWPLATKALGEEALIVLHRRYVAEHQGGYDQGSALDFTGCVQRLVIEQMPSGLSERMAWVVEHQPELAGIFAPLDNRIYDSRVITELQGRAAIREVLAAKSLGSLLQEKLQEAPEFGNKSAAYYLALGLPEVAQKFPVLTCAVIDFNQLDAFSPWLSKVSSANDIASGPQNPINLEIILVSTLIEAAKASIVSVTTEAAALRAKIKEHGADLKSVRAMVDVLPTDSYLDRNLIALPDQSTCDGLSASLADSEALPDFAKVNEFVATSQEPKAYDSLESPKKLTTRWLLTENARGVAEHLSDKLVAAAEIVRRASGSREPVPNPNAANLKIEVNYGGAWLVIQAPTHGQDITLTWSREKKDDAAATFEPRFLIGVRSLSELQEVLSAGFSASRVCEIDPDFQRSLVTAQVETARVAFEGACAGVLGKLQETTGAEGYRIVNSADLTGDIFETLRNLAYQSTTNPTQVALWTVVERMHKDGVLLAPQASVPLELPVFGSVDVTIPADTALAKIFAAGKLDAARIRAYLEQMTAEITIPQVTLATNSGASRQLMSQEGAYTALKIFEAQGFTAVLSKSMASRFCAVAAEVYIKNALFECHYGVVLEESPLNGLKWLQKKIIDETIKVLDREKDAATINKFTEAGRAIDSGAAICLEAFGEVLERLPVDVEIQLPDEMLVRKPQLIEYLSIYEAHFDLGLEMGLPGFKRQNSLQREYQFVLRSGFIGQEARVEFKGKVNDWDVFIKSFADLQLKDSTCANSRSLFLEVARAFRTDLAEMAEGKVTGRALQILNGEVAAVGTDIKEPLYVNSWHEYQIAINRLLQTPHVSLVILPGAKLGWTVDCQAPAPRRMSRFGLGY